MKAVILAAGKGTRMQPLTEDTPKPLLPVAGKPIIDHSIDLLRDEVDEIIIVAGYRIEQFRDRYPGEKIRIVEQEEALGTADAALQVSDYIEGETIILNGDDIYGEKIASLERNNVLAARSDNPEKFGVFDTEAGKVRGIEEKPDNPSSNLVNTGCFCVEKDFFELLETVEKSDRGEYEITDALERYIREKDMEVVEADRWLPCSYPWQLVDANEELMKDIEGRIEGEVSDRAEIIGEVVVEDGAEIREYSTIEGPAIIKEGAIVGPQAYIRETTVVGKNAFVGNSEVKNSVIGEGSSVPHFSYVGDSYLGKNVNIGAGTKIANLRNDSSDVMVKVKGELVDTCREKLGAIIGSEAKIGVNNSIKPGRKIGYRSSTDAGEKVKKTVPSERTLKDGEIL